MHYTSPKAALLRSVFAGSLGACLSALAASGAHAQAADTARSNDLEEIVVTAERREARLQDVPISVTALTNQQLEAKQITDVTSLVKLVPGMGAKATLTPLEITMAIRGVTQLNTQVTVDPPIGTYVDGFYTSVNPGTNTAMVDMERVEVLKGPQGTLFGRNTIGGAISITTKSPTDEFEGYGQVNLGNFGAQTYTGVVSGPIIADRLSGRLVYQYSEHDGYGRNLTLNSPTSTLTQGYLRGQLKAKLTDDWEVLVSGFYTRSTGNNTGTKLVYVDPTVRIQPALPPNNVFIPIASGRPGDLLSNYIGRGGYWDTFTNQADKFYLRQYGFTGTVTGKLGEAVTLKAITGYRHTNFDTVSDIDATPYEVIQLTAFPLSTNEFSQELQIYGDAMDGKLEWIAGAYYYRLAGNKLSYTAPFHALVPPGAPRTVNPSGPYAINKSYSAFVQLTYELAPELRVTGGIRYVRDERSARWHDHSTFRGQIPGPFISCVMANAPAATTYEACTLTREDTFKFVPWTVGVDYKPTDDVLLYAKVSQGYRSGAYGSTVPVATPNPTQNAFLISTFQAVEPEELFSPEVGAKVELFDRRLRLNGAVYYSKYKNIQLSTNVSPDASCIACLTVNVLQNSGTAEIWGGELEMAAVIGNLRLDAALGITDPKYVEGPFVGTDLINISKTNWSAGAAYIIETSLGTLTPSVNYSWRSKQTFFTLAPGAPQAQADAVSQKSYGLWDARVSFEVSTMPLTLSVYGANLANKKYAVSATNFGVPFGFAVNWPGAPRTYGVSLRYDF